MRILISVLFLLNFIAGNIAAQVKNDSIAHAYPLEIGVPVKSTTAYCTIEKNCINEEVTGRCIKFHNDQWFTFNSGTHRQLYLNIFNQQCRDLLGVQALVIDGEPCQPETYQVLACVSLQTQDDIHVPLTNLKPDYTYLLNIDGYLHDFCDFEIEISTQPKGISEIQLVNLHEQNTLNQNVVSVNWEMPDSLKRHITHFEIWKRNEAQPKFHLYKSVAAGRNVQGEVQKNYVITDTLTDHLNYYYKLVAVNQNGHQMLANTYRFRVDPLKFTFEEEKIAEINLDFKNNTPVIILIKDTQTGKVLNRNGFKFKRKHHSKLLINLQPYISHGFKHITIEAINTKTGARQRFFFN